MAIRDALKSKRGARAFAEGLYALLYGPGNLQAKFSRWCEVVATDYVPVLLGGGRRLFGDKPVRGPGGLQRTGMIESPSGTTHLSYRVVR